MNLQLYFRHLLSLVLLTCLTAFSYAQNVNTIGLPNTDEDVWDTKPLPGGGYMMLSNTTAFGPGASRILMTQLTATRTFLSATFVFDPANPNIPVIGRNFVLDLDAAGNHIGYIIVGTIIQPAATGGQRMVVIRTDLAGTVTWTQTLFNMSNNVQLRDEGVSIERQANGDVVAIGSSFNPASGINLIAAIRFTPAGFMVWARRYRSGPGFSFFPAESCNGVRSGTDVVAITGKFEQAAGAAAHTFICIINAATGAELVRKTYTSNATFDEGLDIVQMPANSRYMIVGRASTNTTTGALGSDLWVVKVNGLSGGLTNAAVYSATGSPFMHFAGRDVCLNTAGTLAIVTGIFANDVNGGPNRAFALRLNFNAPAPPTWAFAYTSAEPNPAGSESIEIDGTGYVIGTTNHLFAAGQLDQHVIRINAAGRHTQAACPEIAFQTTHVVQGTVATPVKAPIVTDFQTIVLQSQPVGLPEIICPFPFDDEDTQADLLTVPNEDDGSLQVYPNPTVAGRMATLDFELQQSGEVDLRILDMTGRQVWAFNGTLDEGRQRLEVPVADWAPGLYHIHLGSESHRQVMKWVIGK